MGPWCRAPLQALAWEGPEATQPSSSSWAGDASHGDMGQPSYGDTGRGSYEPHYDPSEWGMLYPAPHYET